jgi:prepilin signal peptidase PulO-like enzyme (type II secretory pathway)
MGRNRLSSSLMNKPPKKAFANPLRLFTYPDVMLLLFYNGIFYSVFYGVAATISTLFQTSYPFLSETDIGLCYLAIGGGMLFGSLLTGKFLDRDYQTIKNEMMRKAEADGEKGMRPEDVTKEENFPIERARLRTTPIYLAVFVAATVGYGWCLQKNVNLAVPLILQIISES